jgi:hypothetical protein
MADFLSSEEEKAITAEYSKVRQLLQLDRPTVSLAALDPSNAPKNR